MLSRFLRSEIQATDSTLMGCSANNAATMKLRPAYPVARCNTQNNSAAFSACSSRLVLWCREGFESEELAVESVGEPGQGMPVGRVEGGESPLHGVPFPAG